ncbi:MAG: SDR family NAD(P)-dependent oxidoreductase [Hyphomicrobium sp.]
MASGSEWRTAWIAGASTGIGRELAIALAKRGVKVAVSARSTDTLDELAASNSGIFAFPVDVTDRAGIAATVAAIKDKLGAIDLAILNAGIWQPMGTRPFDAGKNATSMSVNYQGVCNALEAIMPDMISAKSGRIGLVSSVAGYRGLPKAAAYAPSKAAVISLAEVLAPELARSGVVLSVINPGFVETPMTAVNDFPMPFIIKADDAAERILKGLATGRFEIAFPWQLVWLLKTFRVLPYPVFMWYVRTFMTPHAK